MLSGLRDRGDTGLHSKTVPTYRDRIKPETSAIAWPRCGCAEVFCARLVGCWGLGLQLPRSNRADVVYRACAGSKRSRGGFEFWLNGRGRARWDISLSYVDMEATAPSGSDSSSLADQTVSSRIGNRSLRVAEKERRKNETDPFASALKYFCDGGSWPRQNN